MNIVISDMARKECLEKFHISEKSVLDVIKSPHHTEEMSLDEKTKLLYFLKKIEARKRSFYTIVCAFAQDNQSLRVDLVFKIPESILSSVSEITPLNTLESFAEHYGMVFTIFNTSKKFFLAENIPTGDVLINNINEITKINNPDNHHFLQSLWLRINTEKQLIECRICFIVDVSKYLREV